jgi:hypothetical protein
MDDAAHTTTRTEATMTCKIIEAYQRILTKLVAEAGSDPTALALGAEIQAAVDAYETHQDASWYGFTSIPRAQGAIGIKLSEDAYYIAGQIWRDAENAIRR